MIVTTTSQDDRDGLVAEDPDYPCQLVAQCRECGKPTRSTRHVKRPTAKSSIGSRRANGKALSNRSRLAPVSQRPRTTPSAPANDVDLDAIERATRTAVQGDDPRERLRADPPRTA